MRAFICNFSAACAALALMAAEARAETRSFVAEPGKYLDIGGGYSLGTDNCSAYSLPKVVISTRPAHGKTFVWDYPFVVPGGRPCAGSHIKIRRVVYTPMPGYHGPDTVAFDLVPQKGAQIGPGQAHNVISLTVR